MATNFPTSLDSLTNPTSSDSLASPSHAAQHANVNDAVEALQAKVGVDGSAVTTSLDYKVANQGLTLVKSQTIGSGVSSVTVSDAFSSTFDNYKVLIVVDAFSTSAADIRLQLGAVTTGYYWSQLRIGLGATSTAFSSGTGGDTSWLAGLSQINRGTTVTVELQDPARSKQTFYSSTGHYAAQTVSAGPYTGGGYLNNTGTQSSLTVFPASGTMTGGTIRVYGYNNG